MGDVSSTIWALHWARNIGLGMVVIDGSFRRLKRLSHDHLLAWYQGVADRRVEIKLGQVMLGRRRNRHGDWREVMMRWWGRIGGAWGSLVGVLVVAEGFLKRTGISGFIDGIQGSLSWSKLGNFINVKLLKRYLGLGFEGHASVVFHCRELRLIE